MRQLKDYPFGTAHRMRGGFKQVVSGEWETVYFWRFGIHFLFGGSSSLFRKKISSSVGGFSSLFGLGYAVGALRGN